MSTNRRPAPRPKRSGEEFARSHYDNSGPDAKKPRFDVRNPSALAPDAPEEDAILDADEIGKSGQQTKRNAVNIDGYESDSSNEGFDARADAKHRDLKRNGDVSGGQGSKQEEENDMFADLEEEEVRDGEEDEEVTGEGKKKQKDVRFLGAEEIEGQVGSSKSGGHVSADLLLDASGKGKARAKDKEVDSSSESDVGDEERADAGEVDDEIGAGGKKEHAPKLDAFNLKNEQEEGRFDAQGNFVRKAVDPHAVHDSWLEGVSKKDMKKAKEAAERRDEETRQKRIEDDSLLTSDILKTLIPNLEKGETVLEALARLGKSKAKRKPRWQQNKNKRKLDDGMDVDNDEAQEDPAEIRRREAVEAITGAADRLLTRGQTEIYDAERELLIRQYSRDTGEEWVDAPANVDTNDVADETGASKQWEYRWLDARDGGQANGPYDGTMMSSWNDAGYFGDGVEFRECGKGHWSRVVDFG